MRIPNSTVSPRGGTNLTPMVDVVFLLIVFFLVSSHLARQENRLPLQLPTAATVDPLDLDQAPLTVSVDARGRVLIAGNVVEEPALRAILNEFAASTETPPAIRIRCDGRVPYRDVQPVLRAAGLAGMTDASIAVRQRSP